MPFYSQYERVPMVEGQTGYAAYPYPIYPNRSAYGWHWEKPEALVHHYTVGGLQSSLRRLTTEISTHFLVDRDGTIYQLVDTDDAAWTCGVQAHRKRDHWLNAYNENLPTVNIEVVNAGWAWSEGPRDSSNPESYEPYTGPQIDAVIELRDLMAREYGIPIDREHQVGHEELDRQKQDPGPRWPWEVIAVMTLDPTDHDRLLNAMHWYGQLMAEAGEVRPGFLGEQHYELEDGSVVSAEVIFDRIVNQGQIVK